VKQISSKYEIYTHEEPLHMFASIVKDLSFDENEQIRKTLFHKNRLKLRIQVISNTHLLISTACT